MPWICPAPAMAVSPTKCGNNSGQDIEDSQAESIVSSIEKQPGIVAGKSGRLMSSRNAGQSNACQGAVGLTVNSIQVVAALVALIKDGVVRREKHDVRVISGRDERAADEWRQGAAGRYRPCVSDRGSCAAFCRIEKSAVAIELKATQQVRCRPLQMEIRRPP